MLTVLREDVLPLTQQGVREGNKVFGAAVLRKASLELVIAGPNEEARNPLLHGEISCLNRYWSLPRESRPPPAECLFLSSHEPCPMCLSAIAWSGFDNFYYFFSYEDSRDEFEIPHDLTILAEVFRCPDGAYADANAYWKSHHLLDGRWLTIARTRLNSSSAAVFQPKLKRGRSTLRVAISVNQAGGGYLAGFSASISVRRR